MALKGIKGVKSVNLAEGNLVTYDPDGSYKVKKEWFLSTDGSNLLDAMMMDHIDTERSFTNDIIENFEIFGIEGVRMRIHKELEKLFSGEGVNQRHINVLTDLMTYRGTLMPIDRHGINRSPDNGVIAKASFEEVTDMFLKAATFAEHDNMRGISGNVMFGQLIPSGTNAFELMFDEEKLMETMEEEEGEEPIYEPDELNEDNVQEDINEMYGDMDEELMIGDEDFEFGYNLENVQEYNLGLVKKDIDEEEVVKVIDTDVGKKKIKVKQTKKN